MGRTRLIASYLMRLGVSAVTILTHFTAVLTLSYLANRFLLACPGLPFLVECALGTVVFLLMVRSLEVIWQAGRMASWQESSSESIRAGGEQ